MSDEKPSDAAPEKTPDAPEAEAPAPADASSQGPVLFTLDQDERLEQQAYNALEAHVVALAGQCNQAIEEMAKISAVMRTMFTKRIATRVGHDPAALSGALVDADGNVRKQPEAKDQSLK